MGLFNTQVVKAEDWEGLSLVTEFGLTARAITLTNTEWQGLNFHKAITHAHQTGKQIYWSDAIDELVGAGHQPNSTLSPAAQDY